MSLYEYRAPLLQVAAVLFCLPALAAEPVRYTGIVVSVTDGDSMRVRVPAFAATPWAVVSVRVAGIDTPEPLKSQAKCMDEVALGKAASAYAKTLAHPGDPVTIIFRGLDKYSRIDGDVLLPDGRDFGSLMLTSGNAFPYDGKTKRSYCKKDAGTTVRHTAGT
jgi:micrococcal nuclease